MEPSGHECMSTNPVYDSPVVESLKKDEALFLSECEHLARFFGSISTWLFKQDMLSSCERLHSPLIVEAIWQLSHRRPKLPMYISVTFTPYRIIHNINLRVVEQLCMS